MLGAQPKAILRETHIFKDPLIEIENLNNVKVTEENKITTKQEK